MAPAWRPRRRHRRDYGVTSPPTTFLIDPSGRITVEPEIGPATQAELQDMIDQARNKRSGRAGRAMPDAAVRPYPVRRSLWVASAPPS